MKKFIFATALMFVTAVALQAAPKLGVTWRAVANPKTPGVKILSVDAGSNAEELGLEVGDTVVAINDKVVSDGKSATAAVEAANGKLKLLIFSQSSGLVVIAADIDEATAGLVANPDAKGKYKNIKKSKK